MKLQHIQVLPEVAKPLEDLICNLDYFFLFLENIFTSEKYDSLCKSVCLIEKMLIGFSVIIRDKLNLKLAVNKFNQNLVNHCDIKIRIF